MVLGFLKIHVLLILFLNLMHEQLIKKSGLHYTIFRPSYILGVDDYLTKNISKQILKKQVLIPGSGNFVLQPISIDDVCLCINIALYSYKVFK